MTATDPDAAPTARPGAHPRPAGPPAQPRDDAPSEAGPPARPRDDAPSGAGPPARPRDEATSGAGTAVQPGGGGRSLADRQAELVAALTSGGPVPEGFDARLVDVARVALLRKRAGEVARHWPSLAAAFGRGWTAEFARWAATRPTRGSLRDGWDLARDLAARAALAPSAAAELAAREAELRYDGAQAPRVRRAPAVGRAAGSIALQIAGRVRVLRRG